jgi:uncharacterized protein YdaU (DUF1376 family)
MTDLAWMKTYIGDEAAITSHLTAEEFGAFERLRRHYWQHGHLPNDDERLARITGLEPQRWPTIASAISSLFAKGWRLPRLDSERLDAADKREKKIAAGRKGAAARWGDDGKTNADANSENMATAMAEPMRNQWPPAPAPAPAPNEVRRDERLAPTHPHTREGKVDKRFDDKKAASMWLSAQGGFPGDRSFDVCVEKLTSGTATWADVERASS